LKEKDGRLCGREFILNRLQDVLHSEQRVRPQWA
jgi:hypothetical protein